jgi:hypothetical protein
MTGLGGLKEKLEKKKVNFWKERAPNAHKWASLVG